jgi:hypothetical protein
LSDDRRPGSVAGTTAAVTITSVPLWRVRLVRSLPRYLLYAMCAAGLVASLRFAIAPPRAAAPSRGPIAPLADPAAEAYAALFARRYLTWNASEPLVSQRALAPMVGTELAENAGLILPASGAQHVEWAEVVQARRLGPGTHLYTVAAQTDTAGLLYLTVDVIRQANGSLSLLGYPGLVGGPSEESAKPAESGGTVTDQALAAVVRRALRNYLADSPEELDADLADGVQIAEPTLALTLEGVQRLVWSTAGRSVLAVVQAGDARGVGYTLGYEVGVVEVGGRWEVSGLQVSPTE